jgi:hypothetical protein
MGNRCHFAHGDAELRSMNDVSTYTSYDVLANPSRLNGIRFKVGAILEALVITKTSETWWILAVELVRQTTIPANGWTHGWHATELQ